MAICPKCKSHYREDFEACSDCGVELVKESELESMLASEEPITGNWVFLKNVYDGYEQAELTDLLEVNDIPYLEKQRGSGQYLKIATGMNNYGTDLYVLENQLDQAKELIQFLQSETQDVLEEIVHPIDENEHPKKQNVLRSYIIIFCMIPIVLLLYMIFSLL